MAITPASDTRFCSPKLRWWIARPRSGRAATAASASATRLLHLRLREVQVPGAEGDVLLHGGGEELVVRVLEDEPHPLVELLGGELADGPPADHDLPRAGLQEADEEVDQRGLPRAVRTQDGDELPLLDVEVDPGERLGAVVVGVSGPP